MMWFLKVFLAGEVENYDFYHGFSVFFRFNLLTCSTFKQVIGIALGRQYPKFKTLDVQFKF